MNNQEYNQEEALLKEALTNAKNDKQIGMPDIEAELHKFHAEHDRQQFVRKRNSLPFKRVAAILLITLALSGIAWGSYMYINAEIATIEEEVTRIEEEPIATLPEALTSTNDSICNLSYKKASLEKIVKDLSKHYNLDEPVFINDKCREIKMHITFNPDGKIYDALNTLNHFGSVQFELKDNHIIVK